MKPNEANAAKVPSQTRTKGPVIRRSALTSGGLRADAIAERDRDRRRTHGERDGVRNDEEPVVDRDPVRDPEHEADEEHAEVRDRDLARRAVLDHLADLERGRDRHQDPPEGGGESEVGLGHGSSLTERPTSAARSARPTGAGCST